MGVSFLPGKAELLGDTLFLFSPTFNRKSYRRPVTARVRGRSVAPASRRLLWSCLLRLWKGMRRVLCGLHVFENDDRTGCCHLFCASRGRF